MQGQNQRDSREPELQCRKDEEIRQRVDLHEREPRPAVRGCRRDRGAREERQVFEEVPPEAGALVALLYAPAAGRETREFLGEKAREGRDRASEVAAKSREVVKQSRETLATAVERGREAYQQARSGAPRENA